VSITISQLSLVGGGGSLQALQNECLEFGGGVLDGGSSGTVAGANWVRGIEEKFNLLFDKTATSALYTFGAGEKRAAHSVIIPLKSPDNGPGFRLRTDVVPGDLPLLISRRSQISMQSVLKSAQGLMDVTSVDGSRTGTFPLKESSTGHWLVNLGL
jgi:hypothetical protein